MKQSFESYGGGETPETNAETPVGKENTTSPEVALEMKSFALEDRMHTLESTLQDALQQSTTPEIKQKIIEKLQELRGLLPTPLETVSMVNDKTPHTPEYLSTVDAAEEDYKKESKGILEGMKNVFDTLGEYLPSPKTLLLAPVLWMFEGVREHPLLTLITLFVLFAATVGVGPALTALLSGAGAFWEQFKKMAKFLGIDEYLEDLAQTVMTYVVGGYASVKGGKFLAKKGAHAVGKVAKNAGKKIIGKGAQAAGSAVAKKSSLGIAARVASMLKKLTPIGMVLTPTTMGDGSLSHEDIQRYINNGTVWDKK